MSARFEPTNLWSNGKHDNHYTTENDWYIVKTYIIDFTLKKVLPEYDLISVETYRCLLRNI
jgi:hypothetical protein